MRQSAHVVQPRPGVQQTLVPEGIDLEFALQESVKLEQEGLPVEGLSQKFPRSCSVCFQALGSTRRTGGRDYNRGCRAESRVASEHPTYLEAMKVRHLGIEDNEIGLAVRALSSACCPVYARTTEYPAGPRMLSSERADHSWSLAMSTSGAAGAFSRLAIETGRRG